MAGKSLIPGAAPPSWPDPATLIRGRAYGLGAPLLSAEVFPMARSFGKCAAVAVRRSSRLQGSGLQRSPAVIASLGGEAAGSPPNARPHYGKLIMPSSIVRFPSMAAFPSLATYPEEQFA
jgi:hypothetical protein